MGCKTVRPYEPSPNCSLPTLINYREPAFLAIFSQIWSTNDLIVSFDGINITFPNNNIKQTQPWPHVDQSPSRPGLQCVQGVLNLTSNGPREGGLVVLKESHKYNKEFFAQSEFKSKNFGDADWFSFNEKQIGWFKKRSGGGCKWVKVCAEPGDLILWESRTMHYNILPESDAVRAAMCELLCFDTASFCGALTDTLDW